jgi:hypothetical protein
MMFAYIDAENRVRVRYKEPPIVVVPIDKVKVLDPASIPPLYWEDDPLTVFLIDSGIYDDLVAKAADRGWDAYEAYRELRVCIDMADDADGLPDVDVRAEQLMEIAEFIVREAFREYGEDD